VISVRHNFLFIHRGKSGGNSISEALLPFSEDTKTNEREVQDGVDRFDVVNPQFGTRKHDSLQQYRENLPAELFERLYKFSVLRNPYERLVSAYFSPHRVLGGEVQDFDREQFVKLIEHEPTLRDFLCLDASDGIVDRIDFLMRFERLEADFKMVCQEIGLPQVSLPHRNRGARREYRDYFDAEARRLTEDRFGEEIELGQYHF